MDNQSQQLPSTPSPPTIQQSSGFPKFLIIIMIIFFISAVGTGAYYLGSRNVNLSTQQQILPSPTPIISSPTPTSDLYLEPTGYLPVGRQSEKTMNWKIYVSSSADFSVKYPPNWNEINSGDSSSYADQVSFGPGITGMTEDVNIKLWVQVQRVGGPSPIKNADEYIKSSLKGSQGPNFVRGNIEGTLVDGKQGYKLIYTLRSNVGLNKFVTIAVDYNNLIYVISGRESEEFNQILSTFKFLDN